MPPKAELKMDTFVEATPEAQAEAEAAILAGLEQMNIEKKEEETVSDPATLADMLGEGFDVPARGTVFYGIPLCIRDLKGVLELLNTWDEARVLGGGSFDRVMEIGVELARRLFWVKEGSKLRTARDEELLRCFTYARMEASILEALGRNGLELDAKKNQSSQTGPTSSAESVNDSPDTPSEESGKS